MAGRDRRLQRVVAVGAAERLGTLQRGQPAADQQPVPVCAVLLEQQDRFAVRSHARLAARGLQFHQRQQAVHFRSEEHTSELQSLMRISYAVFCLKKKTYNKNKTY